MKLRLVMIMIIAPMLSLSGSFAAMTISDERERRQAASTVVVRATEQVVIKNLIHE